MSQINVRPGSMKDDSEKLSRIAGKLENIASSLDEINFNLERDHHGTFDDVKKAVLQLSSDIRQNKVNLTDMKEKLDEIEKLYEDTEKKICNRSFDSGAVREAMNEIEKEINDSGNAGGGTAPTHHKDGEPVDMSTGNYFIHHCDLLIQGLFPIKFDRYYNSIHPQESTFGMGWTHTFMKHLLVKEKEIILCSEDGSEEAFEASGDGTFTSRYGNASSVHTDGNHYIYKKDDCTFIFASDGKLQKEADLYDNSLSLTYRDGRLFSVISGTGESVKFRYDAAGFLCGAEDHTGRKTVYEHAGDNLTAVILPDGSRTEYTYNELNEIVSVRNALGTIVLENEYDSKRRITAQHLGEMGSILFAYKDDERETVSTALNGDVTVYCSDRKFRTKEVRDKNGTEKIEYNAFNQRTKYTDRAGNTTVYEYDAEGMPLSVTDALGNRKQFSYDRQGRLIRILLPNGQVSERKYNQDGSGWTDIDAEGNSTAVLTEKNGKLKKIIYPDTFVRSFLYDDRGNVITVRENHLTVKSYEYDALNRVISETDALGSTFRYTYDAAGRQTVIVNPEGSRKTFEYNALGDLIKETDYDGFSEEWIYSGFGLPEKYRNKDGFWTEYKYGNSWLPEEVLSANGGKTCLKYDSLLHVTDFTSAAGGKYRILYNQLGAFAGIETDGKKVQEVVYNALGKPVQKKDSHGNCTRYAYDESGRLIRTEDPAGNDQTYEYDLCGNLIKLTDEENSTSEMTYTSLGRIRSKKDKDGGITEFTYYPGGRIKEICLPDGQTVNNEYDANGKTAKRVFSGKLTYFYTYDSMGRVIRIRSSAGEEKNFTYSPTGKILKCIGENGGVRKFEYTPSGKIKTAEDALGNKMAFYYDCMGSMTEMRRFEKNTQKYRSTRYEYDLNGNIVRVINPAGDARSFVYDHHGRLISRTDEEGYTTGKEYYNLREPEKITFADGRNLCFHYDALNRMNSFEDWMGITQIERDRLGRICKVTDPDKLETGYQRSAMGNCTRLQYPDGEAVQYTYSSGSQLTELHRGSMDVRYRYDLHDLSAEKEFSNGIKEILKADEAGHITEIVHSHDDRIINRFRYQYDASGNRISAEISRKACGAADRHCQYHYDLMDRLVSVKENGETVREYTYDSFGNRIRLKEKDKVTDYQYNENDQLIFYTVKGKEKEIRASFEYDKRGNLISRTLNGKKYHYQYDAAGKMTGAVSPDGEKCDYLYNGLGYLVSQNVHGEKIKYTCDLTKDSKNILTRSTDDSHQDFIWDRSLAASVDKDLKENQDGSRYYLTDEIASVLDLADSQGNITESAGYDEYGRLLPGMKRCSSPFGYAGYLSDPVSGLENANYRYYDSDTGRFCGRDYYKGFADTPLSLNEYLFCRDNPCRYADENGKFAWAILAAILVGAGLHSFSDYVSEKKDGTWDSDGWDKHLEKLAVGALQGGLETAAGIANPLAGAIVTIVAETGGNVWKDYISGENITGEVWWNELQSSIVPAVISLAASEIGDILLKQFAPGVFNSLEEGIKSIYESVVSEIASLFAGAVWPDYDNICLITLGNAEPREFAYA